MALTKVFSEGEKKVIEIPLSKDKYGEPINKYRKFYNMYCGMDTTMDIEYAKIAEIEKKTMVETVPLEGQTQKLAVKEC